MFFCIIEEESTQDNTQDNSYTGNVFMENSHNEPKYIEVRGACVHNLKNVDVNVPLHQIVGIAGVSGSGKSSLALGVLYAEGSRRYLELDHLALLPHESNFWYGSTVANMDAVGMYVMQGVNINSFWSMEPLLGPVDMAAAEGLPEWVILGAETGNRPDKVTPAREWVDNIVAFCEENEIPVFFKENLRKHFPDLPASAFPWEV